MDSPEIPVYPLTVIYSDGTSEAFEDEEDLVLNLEWFDDSDDPEDPAVVRDQLGRRCRLRIEEFEVIWLELINSDGPVPSEGEDHRL